MSTNKDEYLWHSNYNLEVAILYSIGALGIMLNIVQLICILIEKEFRNLLSAFLIHGALINAVLASYCIVFALSLHDKSFKNFCNYLGSSFVVLMTANIVNLIAIIASEVYKLGFVDRSWNYNDNNHNVSHNNDNNVNSFSENNNNNNHNNHNNHNNNDQHDNKTSPNNICCVIFGLAIVYVASLILHLGPTLIAGNFDADHESGFCLFIFGQTKNYVVFVVWIVIVTLVLMASSYYLCSFHSSLNRLISQRHSIDQREQFCSDQKTNKELLLTKSRAWTLSCVTGLHFLCWYPLFLVLISDRNFRIPIGLYRALTCLAWSNSFLEPLIYLLLDRKTASCCTKIVVSKNKRTSSIIHNGEQQCYSIDPRLERIGDRLKTPVIEDELEIELDEIDNRINLHQTQRTDWRTFKNRNFIEC